MRRLHVDLPEPDSPSSNVVLPAGGLEQLGSEAIS